jgi:dienelactone hydrolase
VYQRTLEVGRESFRRSPQGFDQQVLIPMLNLRAESHSRPGSDGHLGSFELQIFNALGDSARGSYTVAIAHDSARISAAFGQNVRTHTRSADFDAVLPPQSVASFAQLVESANGRDTTLLLLVVGPDTVLPASLSFTGDTARVRFAGLEVIAQTAGGRVRRLEIPVQQARAELAPPGDSLPALAGLDRPAVDYTAPPGAAYAAAEVRVPVAAPGDTFSLGCTLTLPTTGRPPFPAAVTITGSGSQNRDEELWPLVRGYRPFRQIAGALAERGIAVLRCDDRGNGASGGRTDSATTATLAGDTRAAVAWLRTRPEISARRIALIGHSEGGLIGPMVAAEDRGIGAVVVMAGPGKRGEEILIDQARWPIQTALGLDSAERAERLATVTAAVRRDTLPASLWLRWFRQFDPLTAARRVRQPVLILQGALDRQVSAGQADTLATAMRAGGNRDVTVRVFPGLNHLFLPTDGDGSPAEYATLPETRLPESVLGTLGDWLRARLRR